MIEALVVREVTDPRDPAIAGFGRMQRAAYFAPETLIPAEYIPHMLGGSGRTGSRRNFLLVAEIEHRVVGGTLFHWLAEAGRAFPASWASIASCGDGALPAACTRSGFGCSTAPPAGTRRASLLMLSVRLAYRPRSSNASAGRALTRGTVGARSRGWALARWISATSSLLAGQTGDR